MVSKPREKKKPNYFRFIRDSILGNLSVTVFHSGHLSHARGGEEVNRIAVRKPSPPTNFSGNVLFRHRLYHQVRKEEIFKFCQNTGGRFSSTRQPHAFLLRRPELHASSRKCMEHFPATRFHLQPRLTPSSHSPSMLVPSEPCKCIFWGFFVSVSPLNSLSSDLR